MIGLGSSGRLPVVSNTSMRSPISATAADLAITHTSKALVSAIKKIELGSVPEGVTKSKLALAAAGKALTPVPSRLKFLMKISFAEAPLLSTVGGIGEDFVGNTKLPIQTLILV